MKLKYWWIVSTAISGLLLSSGIAQAHSGGTNGSGCHNNHSTGDYHCHNGGGSDSSSPDTRPSRYPSSGSSQRTSPSRGVYAPGNIIELPNLSSSDRDGDQSQDFTTPDASQMLWTVVSVGDGDTVRVNRGGETTTVRLACIDAPEMAQAPYGQQSKAQLQSWLPTGTTVSLRPVDVDRYDRLVAEVFSQNTNINLSMVQSGHAVAYRQYLSKCNGSEYLNAEAIAQQTRSAFWSASSPIMPWDFRRQ